MMDGAAFDITVGDRTYRASAANRRHGLTVSLALHDAGGAVLFADRLNLDKVGDRDQWAAGAGVPVADLDTVRETVAEALAAEDAVPGMPSSGRGPSQATAIVGLVQEAGAELWHDPDGIAYASLPVGDHRETWRLRSRQFKEHASRLYHATEAKAAGAQALQDAITTLSGLARFDGSEHTAHVRVAEHDGDIYLDLGDDAWRAVRVTAEGWTVVGSHEVPVKFRRPTGMQPLPEPVRNGRLDDLRELLHIAADDDFCLLVAWLVAALRPSGPYPVLALTGEAGSAKSTTARILRRLIDPNAADLRSQPHDERDLAIAASNGQVIAFDNLSYLPPWFSDALCRVATGGGFGTRTLYADDEETLFDFVRPVLMTSIAEVGVRGDLLDRMLPVLLSSVTRRRTEADLDRAFQDIRPGVLGVLLDAVSTALKRLPTTTIADLPRMADFAVWSEAAAPAFGWKPGAFLAAYGRNREAANAVALESSPVADAVRAFIYGQPDGRWSGTASELLDLLTTGTAFGGPSSQRGWPKAAHVLTGQLKRLAPNLRSVGIEVETGAWESVPGTGHGRRRVVRVVSRLDNGPSKRAERAERSKAAENRMGKPKSPNASPFAEAFGKRAEACGPEEAPPVADLPNAPKRAEAAEAFGKRSEENGLATPFSDLPHAPNAPHASSGGIQEERT